jgi:hypothetical protein
MRKLLLLAATIAAFAANKELCKEQNKTACFEYAKEIALTNAPMASFYCSTSDDVSLCKNEVKKIIKESSTNKEKIADSKFWESCKTGEKDKNCIALAANNKDVAVILPFVRIDETKRQACDVLINVFQKDYNFCKANCNDSFSSKETERNYCEQKFNTANWHEHLNYEAKKAKLDAEIDEANPFANGGEGSLLLMKRASIDSLNKVKQDCAHGNKIACLALKLNTPAVLK